MTTVVFLATEFVSLTKPHVCNITGVVKKVHGRLFHEAKISPVIPRSILNTDSDVDCVYLALAQPGVAMADVGRKHVMVDIYSIPDSSTETATAEQVIRLGMGSLHETMEAAKKRMEDM